MNEVYEFLTKAQLRVIVSMKSVVERITDQTLQCSYFIQEYSRNEKFHMSTLCHNTITSELTCLARDEAYQEHVSRN